MKWKIKLLLSKYYLITIVKNYLTPSDTRFNKNNYGIYNDDINNF